MFLSGEYISEKIEKILKYIAPRSMPASCLGGKNSFPPFKFQMGYICRYKKYWSESVNLWDLNHVTVNSYIQVRTQ